MRRAGEVNVDELEADRPGDLASLDVPRVRSTGLGTPSARARGVSGGMSGARTRVYTHRPVCARFALRA